MDVLYQTRIQKERFQDRPEDYEAAKGKYIVDAALMQLLKKDSVVMHPLPRVDEVGTGQSKCARHLCVSYILYLDDKHFLTLPLSDQPGGGLGSQGRLLQASQEWPLCKDGAAEALPPG